MSRYEERCEQLRQFMNNCCQRDVGVAFSGGVDSSLVLKLASEAARKHGTKVYALMLHTMLHPTGEVDEARVVAEETGAIFKVLTVDELKEAGIADNPPDRCYRCKKLLFQAVIKEAGRDNVTTILEGTNEDDLHVYRPGIQAVKELGVISPLARCSFTKQDVRALAKAYGISVFDKPSAPCLATRFPYGTRISYEQMRRVEAGEAGLKKLQMYNVRLRVHDDLVRIEVDADRMAELLAHRQEMITLLKELGYRYITLDLEGFRSGSMDLQIPEK